MPRLDKPISIAIETTCRAGGIAIGSAGRLVEALPFDTARRSAVQVIGRLDQLVQSHGLTPRDVDEIYVAVGPGSFTGTRVGVTVAKTLLFALPKTKAVAVQPAQAVAWNCRQRSDVQHLAVVLDARRQRTYCVLFERRQDQLTQIAAPVVGDPAEFLAGAPRPLYLAGEGLGYFELAGQGVIRLPEEYWLPRVEGIWALGAQRAQRGEYIAPQELLPAYTTKPEVVVKEMRDSHHL